MQLLFSLEHHNLSCYRNLDIPFETQIPSSLHKKYEPTLPEGYRAKAVDILNRTDGHETKVPASRIARYTVYVGVLYLVN